MRRIYNRFLPALTNASKRSNPQIWLNQNYIQSVLRTDTTKQPYISIREFHQRGTGGIICGLENTMVVHNRDTFHRWFVDRAYYDRIMYRFGTKRDLFTTVVRSWNVEQEEDHMVHLIHGAVEQDIFDTSYDHLVESIQSTDFKPTISDFSDTTVGFEG